MDSRQAFEAWASDNVSHPTFGGKYVRDGAWSYNHNFMDAHWRCWQEATERAARVCEDARDLKEEARAILAASTALKDGNVKNMLGRLRHESMVRLMNDALSQSAAAIRSSAPPQA